VTVEGDRGALTRIAAAAERIGDKWIRVLLLENVSRATALLGDRTQMPSIAGHVADAVAMTSEYESSQRINERWGRTEVLGRAAEMLALVGEDQQARDVIEQALVAAHRTRFEREPGTLMMITGLMARTGRVDRAAELAHYGATAAHRALLLVQIALALPDGPAVEIAEQAAAAAGRLGNAAERISVLSVAAQVMIAAGRSERALGLLDEACAAVDMVDDRIDRAQVLSRLAVTWAAVGERRRVEDAIANAVAVADAIDDPEHVMLLGELLATASEIGGMRLPALNPERVFQLAQAARLTDSAAGQVAVALARAGATAQALALAGALGDEEHKADALGGVLLVSQGQNTAAAQATVAQVRALAGQLHDHRHRSVLLDRTVETLARSRAYDEAVALAQEIEDPLVAPPIPGRGRVRRGA
jgi:hypothetical protein